jgi:hypothetical protein
MNKLRLVITIAMLLVLFKWDVVFAESWDTINQVCKSRESKLPLYVGSVSNEEIGDKYRTYGDKYKDVTKFEVQSCLALQDYIKSKVLSSDLSYYSPQSEVYATDLLCAQIYIWSKEYYDEKCVKPIQIAKEQAEARAKIAACLATTTDECTATIKACAINPASNPYCNNWGGANENGWLGIKQAYEAKLAQTEAAKAQQLAVEQKKSAGWNLDASKVLDELKAGKDPSTFKEGVEAVELGNLNANQKGYDAAKVRSDALIGAIQALAVAQKAAQEARTAADKPGATDAEIELATTKESELESAKQAYQTALAPPQVADSSPATAVAPVDYPSELKMLATFGVIRAAMLAEQDAELKKDMKKVRDAISRMGAAVTQMRKPDAPKTPEFIAEKQQALLQAKQTYIRAAAQVKEKLKDADKIKKWDEATALVNENWQIKPEEIEAAKAASATDDLPLDDAGSELE